MDKVDNKILIELVRDSRIPYSKLAKKCKVSREVVTYRVNRLKHTGIIHDFYTEIDVKKLGYVSALFFVRIKASYEREFIEYIKKVDFASWAGTHCGLWSLGMAIYGKDTSEVERRFQEIYSKFKKAIIDHRFEFYKNTRFFYEKYFNAANIEKPRKTIEYKLDNLDKKILKILAGNSRATAVDLATEFHLTAPAISKRIKKLEHGGYIKKYSIFVNIAKMNKFLFVYFIQNKNIDNRQKLYKHLEAHPKVPFLIDYLGDPFVEFGVFVDSPYDVRKIAQEIEETFPDNRMVDFFLVQDEFISIGLPKCVFD